MRRLLYKPAVEQREMGMATGTPAAKIPRVYKGSTTSSDIWAMKQTSFPSAEQATSLLKTLVLSRFIFSSYILEADRWG